MKPSWTEACFLAAGVFVGNWLSGPFIVEGRTFLQSFCVGLIAAALVFPMWAVYRYICK
jgi:hypothetical protein